MPPDLLALPLELQLRIFDHVVISPSPIEVNDCRASDRDRSASTIPQAQPALTRTCHHIRTETLKRYYHLNRFQASYCGAGTEDYWRLVQWLQCIGFDNRKLMRSIVTHDRHNS